MIGLPDGSVRDDDSFHALQVIVSVFGPRVADNRAESLTDRAIVKCAYSEAHFASGGSAS